MAAMAVIAMCATVLPARAQNDCPAPTVMVTASKVGIKKLDENATEAQKRDAAVVELGDTIEVTMTGLPELVADGDCRKSKGLPKRTPILFLAAQPIKGLTGYLPNPPTEGKMRFDLVHSAPSKTAWALVLANPWIAGSPLMSAWGSRIPIHSSRVRKSRSASCRSFTPCSAPSLWFC